MPLQQDISCCSTLSGVWDEPTQVCALANLGATKHDIVSPCLYTSKFRKGLEDSGLPEGLADACFVVGGSVVYFMPSISKLSQDKDFPPPVQGYDKRVVELVNIGLVTILILIAVSFYLYKRIRK